jgi:signal transduction histidine kinase
LSADPQAIRAQPFVEIGLLIQRDASLLTERWCRRAQQEQPGAKRVHHAVLRDQLIYLLWSLGRGLAERNENDTSQHHLLAVEHGEQRWVAGWSLTELVRDFQILRLVIVDYLDETLDRPLTSREVMAIGLAVDEAISASVGMYTQYREDYLCQLEAEKTAQETQAAEELRLAHRRKDEFLAILAHELRNPLSPIVHAIEIVKLRSPDDPMLRQAGEMIDRQVQQINRLIGDLLDMTRISRSKLELRKSWIKLTDAVDQAVQTCRTLLDARQHQLSVDLPPEPVSLEADPARLVQVLCNLLTNAAKYTEPGGQIRLIARRDGDWLTLRVEDTGIGIAPDMLPQIFKMYWQVDENAEAAGGGLGIGLALVRSLVELHGGEVTASSSGVGHGSQFTIRLPIGKPA